MFINFFIFMSRNISKESYKITKKDRVKKYKQKSFVIWLTSLSGSGKSTIAKLLEYELYKKGFITYALDGDNIRHGLNSYLGFSKEDREENIRRISEVAKLFVDAGVITIVSFISPYKKDRKFARSILEKDEFIEVYLKAPLEVCEKRDVKGLYQKAGKGEIKDFTGINDPYEKPINPEVILETDKLSEEESVKKLFDYLENKNYI